MLLERFDRRVAEHAVQHVDHAIGTVCSLCRPPASGVGLNAKIAFLRLPRVLSGKVGNHKIAELRRRDLARQHRSKGADEQVYKQPEGRVVPGAGSGSRASWIEPGRVRTSRLRKQPPSKARSGARISLNAMRIAEMACTRPQLIGPRVASGLLVRSTIIRSPSTRMVIGMLTGVPRSIPSLSIQPEPS